MKFNKNQIKLAYKNGVISFIRKQMIVDEVRKHYDINDEIAILRQKEEKSTEFDDYNTVVESCKSIVDNRITEILGDINWKSQYKDS